ncbi:MAG: metallophosphatase domain-containing protein [Candidatus Eremiobacteraeota bacterium]|nr:metallophosphatase domain-containing protein [Candidatus Eremiobacteraeota bacterium]MCW5868206.1 metallophosphatase domain-containing protein [Candidatus Eremiobacteraeota bacterium]
MRIVCLSDTHGLHGQIEVPEGDLLLHGGDLTRRGRLEELAEAAEWLRSLPHGHKVVIGGNHDFCLEQQPDKAKDLLVGLTYLQDEFCHCQGLKIYGSPWQPWFHDWAFNLRRGEPLREAWAKIPNDTDIVVTHGPPQGILDRCYDGREVGCQDLLERLETIQPRLHVFGHIHEAYGQRQVGDTLYVNASSCTLRYQPIQKPIVVDMAI